MKHMIHSVSIMKIAGKISIAPGLMSTDDLKMTLRVLKYCYRNESLAISWIKNLYRGLFLPKGGFAPFVVLQLGLFLGTPKKFSSSAFAFNPQLHSTLYDPLAGVPAILVSFLNQNWTDKPDVGLAREAAFSILGLFRAAEKAESAHPQNKVRYSTPPNWLVNASDGSSCRNGCARFGGAVWLRRLTSVGWRSTKQLIE
jgi:hypothetical protein